MSAIRTHDLRPDFHFQRSDLTTFGVLTASFVFLYAPLIIAHRLLLDDMGRSMQGYLGWEIAGRPLANFLFRILNLGEPAVSVYVLNQVIAILFLAAAGTILAVAFGVRKPLLAAAATFPLGGNPYFLENMSMSFDSPLMAAGVLLATAAAAALMSASLLVRVVVVPVLIVGSLSLYQPTVSIFLIAATFLIARRWLEPESSQTPVWQIIFQGAVAVSIAVIAYFIILRHANLGDYAVHHSQLCNMREGCGAAIKNLAEYWTIVWTDWGRSPLGVATFATIVVGLATLFVDGLKPGSIGRVAVRTLVLLAVLSAVILQYGISLLLAEPVWAPRTFVSFGAVAALAALGAACFATKTRSRLLAVAVLAPILVMDYAMLVTAHAVGAAVLAQKDFETSLVSRIIFDIEQLEQPDIDGLAVIGTAPTSPVRANTERKYPLLPRIVPSPLVYDWMWGHALFALNGLSLKVVPGGTFLKSIEDGTLEPVFTRRSYCVFVSGSTAIVAFRGSTAGC